MNNLITCLTVSMLSGATFADTWTVDDDGKADFDNIQAAVDAASDGDEIVVMPGFYNEAVTLWNKVLTLRGTSTDKVIIDGTGLDTQALIYSGPIDNHGVVVEKLTVQNSPNRGIWMQDSNSIIRDCVIRSNDLNGFVSGSSYSILERCKVLGNCLSGEATGGIAIQNGIINQCIISGNTCYTYGGGIRVVSGNPLIINCLIANNTSSGGGGISMYGSDILVVNCTFINNSCGAIRINGGSFTIENSILWDNQEMVCGGDTAYISNSCLQESWPGENNIVLDPLFDDMYLYTISEDSPCVDTGSDAASESVGLKVDLGGNPRYVGESVDIGAWEFQSSTCPDISGDGIVDVSDLLIVIGYWGSTDSPADLNFDGIVDVSDLLIVVGYWGPCE